MKSSNPPTNLTKAQKGLGAVTNPVSTRFSLPMREANGDWLDDRDLHDGAQNKLQTQVIIEHPQSILTFNKSPDIPFDRSVNAYRGCEHGCIYCYARPSHAYHDLSPGIDFETKLFAKPNAAELLRETLAKSNYRPATIAIGTNTDPYQPIESRYRITRNILDLMNETSHPIGITTKSDRILQDIGILEQLAKLQLTAVAISITTLNSAIARTLEPRAPTPARRLAAVKILNSHGIPVHVNIAPVIPAITDHEIEAIVETATNHGAQSVGVIPVRLPHEVAPLFEEWLEAHFPERRKKVMAIISQMRGGKRNDPNFFSRMKGHGPWADLLHTRIRIARRKNGLVKAEYNLRTDLFRRPVLCGGQLNLF